MGWTAPRTWVASEIVTAAIMNTHVRDNLLALNGFVAKTADQSIPSSTVLTNDTHLLYAIGSTGTYAGDLYLRATSAANAAGDINIGFTFPTGTLHAVGFGPDIGLASGAVQTGNWVGDSGGFTSGVSVLSFGLSTATLALYIHFDFVATATGTLRLQWCQNSSNANASTLKAGSHMQVRQVA